MLIIIINIKEFFEIKGNQKIKHYFLIKGKFY